MPNKIDKEGVFNWWTGRVSNRQLSEYTGMTERNVQYTLASDGIKNYIDGGGRGSKDRRRLGSPARNAVAIVNVLRWQGMTIETAASLLSAVPAIASFPAEIIDFCPNPLDWPFEEELGYVELSKVDPDGGWEPGEEVPSHIFNRHCYPLIRKNYKSEIDPADAVWLPKSIIDEYGIPQGLKLIGQDQYYPDIDPYGFYNPYDQRAFEAPSIDTKFFIIDGKWVFFRYIENFGELAIYYDKIKTAMGMQEKSQFSNSDINYVYKAVACISKDGKVNPICDNSELRNTCPSNMQHFHTKLEVNASLAIRTMKRRAYGLAAPSR